MSDRTPSPTPEAGQDERDSVRRPLLVAGLLALLLALTACDSNQTVSTNRFHECIAAGGSWWADEGNVKWSCTMPGPS